MPDSVGHCCMNVNKGNKMGSAIVGVVFHSALPQVFVEGTMLSRRKEEFKFGLVISLHNTIEVGEVEG